MADKQRSFWSTTSGVVTGIAGTLTGVVGIVTVAAQLGWIEAEGDRGQPDRTTTSIQGAASTVPGGGPSSSSTEPAGRGTVAAPAFAVEPPALRFEALGSRTAAVQLRNTGTVELDLDEVTVDGDDADEFTVGASTCTRAPLAPGRSCSIDVSFRPDRSGSFRATMVTEAVGARTQEVPLSGTALL